MPPTPLLLFSRSEPRSQSGGRDRHGDLSDGDRQGNQEVRLPHQPRELLGPGGPRRRPEHRHRSVSLLMDGVITSAE